MAEKSLQNSVLIQNFYAFYEVLLLQKHAALNDRLEPPIQGDTAPKAPFSVVERIRATLERVLTKQYQTIDSNEGTYAAKYYLEAQYIMVALADEIFLKLRWPGHQEWQNNLLESKIYRTQDAGEKFFSNLDVFLKNFDRSQSDLATLYLMALGLGFRGKFWQDTSANSTVQEYMKRLYNLVHAPAENAHIFPQPYEYTLLDTTQTFLPNLTLWRRTLIAALLFFSCCTYALWHKETQPLSTLSKHIKHSMKQDV